MTYGAVIIDKHGRKRRARPGDVLRDGERFSFLMQMVDEDHDGGVRDAHGLSGGHRRGFMFAEDDRLSDAAVAYEERNERLVNAWRKDRGPSSGKDPRHVAGHSLDDARAAADAAYAERSRRMSEAWRKR